MPGPREHLVCVEHAAAEAQLDSPQAIECRSCQQDFGGVGDPDQARQHPVRVGVADDSAPNLNDAVARVGGEEPDVALQSQRQPQPDGVAVDRGDHRLGQRPRGHVDTRRAEPRPRLRERVLTVTEIGARTERRRCAREHDGPDVVVAVAGPVGVRELLAHPVADGVALPRPVQGDGRHTGVDIQQKCAVSRRVGAGGHGVPPRGGIGVRRL